jgi:uncharacterized protein YndB with AHSA1/START domain
MNKIIAQSARLHCNIYRAFEMFTSNTDLQAWLTNSADVEPVVGGKYELFWNPDDPENNSTLGCKITSIEPNNFLSFEWKGPPKFKHFMNNADPLTHVVVFFGPCEDVLTPCTDVYLIHSGWGSSPEWETARQYFVRAWDMALEQLERCINRLP